MPAKKLYIENCFRDKNLGINTANIIVYKIKQLSHFCDEILFWYIQINI